LPDAFHGNFGRKKGKTGLIIALRPDFIILMTVVSWGIRQAEFLK